uniref:Solute carrier family 25 member 40 n=1 Tax=Ascaris suum TaxID=6253 RepID=F1KYN1_ASCSU
MPNHEVLEADRKDADSISLLQRVVAASSGAFITSLMMTPMDVVKIRLQQQKHPFVRGTCFLYSNGLMDHLCTACADVNSSQPCEWFARPGNFTGTADAFIKITKTEGIRSLWSGLSPTLVMAIPATVLYFSVYDALLLWLRSSYGPDSLYIPMLAGSAARTISTTVVSPLEMVRTKMQSERLTYCEIGLAIKRSCQSDGWLTFWRGWAPTLMRDLPFSAVYWTGYEYLKGELLRRLKRTETSFMISFFCGAVSGSLAAFFTTPFDVVKTHRQITFGEIGNQSHSHAECTAGEANGRRFMSYGDRATKAHINAVTTYGVMKELLQRSGFRALFAGVIPRIVKISPACAIMIGSYEYTKVLFARRNRHNSC